MTKAVAESPSVESTMAYRFFRGRLGRGCEAGACAGGGGELRSEILETFQVYDPDGAGLSKGKS